MAQWTPVDDPTARPAAGRPQSLQGVTTAVVALTVAAMAAQALQAVIVGMGGALPLGAPDRSAGAGALLAMMFNMLIAVVGWVQIAIAVVWMYRASDNVSRFGMRDRQWGPGWAVGSWFIPLANLVLPLLAINEIWRGSDPAATPEDWKQGPVSPLIGWMWGFWVTQQVVGYGFAIWAGVEAFSAVFEERTPGLAGSILVVPVAAAALYILAGVLFILFVRRVDQMQARRMGQHMPAAPF